MCFFVALGGLCGAWAVLEAFGNCEDVALVEGDGCDGVVLVAEVDEECSVVDEEEFVFVLVVVPVEFAFGFEECDLLAIELGGDSGGPVVVEGFECGGEVEGSGGGWTGGAGCGVHGWLLGFWEWGFGG